MSINQNFPSEGPTLNLNFAGSKKLDPRITFTRTSTATYMDDNGLITIAPTNTPRFEHSVVGVGTTVTGVESLGLLIEESRTNLLTYSEQFSDASWVKFNVGVTTNTSSTTAPDGSTNSELMTRTTTSAAYFLQSYTKAASSITYTASAFVKKSVGNFCALTTQGTYPSRAAVVFNIDSGTISSSATAFSSFTNASASIIPYSNGWYRISLTATSDTATTYSTYFSFNSNGVVIDGTDSASNSAGFIWGAQLEVGAFPTSYIPTVASTVTRSEDNASITGANFSGFYNPSEGTMFASIRNQTVRSSITYDSFVALCGSNVNNDTIRIYTQTASGGGAQNKFRFAVSVGGTDGADFGANPGGPDNVGKAIIAYKTNDVAGTVSGITPATDTSVTLPTCVSLQICSAVRFQQKPTATIQQIIYYPTRLTNSQLQNLTK